MNGWSNIFGLDAASEEDAEGMCVCVCVYMCVCVYVWVCCMCVCVCVSFNIVCVYALYRVCPVKGAINTLVDVKFPLKFLYTSILYVCYRSIS